MTIRYGPWQDPIEYTETIEIGTIEFLDPPNDPVYTWGVKSHTIDPWPIDPETGVPFTHAYWHGMGGLLFREFARPEHQTVDFSLSDDLDDGRFDTDLVSRDAWAALVSEPTDAGQVGDFSVDQPIINYWFTFGTEPGTFSYIVHRENWRAAPTEFSPTYTIRTGRRWDVFRGEPEDPPAENYLFTEVDPERSTTALLSEPVSLEAEFNGFGDPRWHFFTVDAGLGADGWLVSGTLDAGDDVFALQDDPSSVDHGNSGAVTYDVAAIEGWKQESPSNFHTVAPELMPHIGLSWEEKDWPLDWKGPDWDYPALADITFTYKWKTARWRWVIEEPDVIPYLRSIPSRDDGLSGGAVRNYPPSRTVQTGNRNVGGVL